jgi:hypothetical protein
MRPEQIGIFLSLQNESLLQNESEDEDLASPDQQVGPGSLFCRSFYDDR